MNEPKTKLVVYLKPDVKMGVRERHLDPIVFLMINGYKFCTDREFTAITQTENCFVLTDEFDLFERIKDGRLYFICDNYLRIILSLDNSLVRKVVDADTGKRLWPK